MTPPNGFRSPPEYGDIISISFEDLCHKISLSNNIPHNDILRTIVDSYNAQRLAYGERKVFCDEKIKKISEQGFGEIIEVDSRKLMQGSFHYNSSLIRHKGKLLLFYRLDHDGYAWVCVVELDENLQPKPDTNKRIELPATDKKISKWEDPRVFHFQGKLHLIYCRWGGIWREFPERKAEIVQVPHQCLVELNDNFEVVKEYPLKYGNNCKEDLWEKNWLPFEHKGAIHIVYYQNPLVIIKITDKGIVKVCDKKWHCPYDGELKGGSNPIKIKNKFYTFYHSHEFRHSSGGGRRYVAGCLAFDEDFNVTDFSYPFLKASELDRNLSWSPLCIFPGSAVYENDEWKIACGYNDWYNIIIKVKHSEVLKRLKPVSLNCVQNKH